MNLLKKIQENRRNLEVLNKISLDAIRITVESCDCPKGNLCDICKDLLEYYRWKKKERERYLDDAIKWLQHQILLVFYGPKYKEQGLHFSRDIYTLREIVELFDEYKKLQEGVAECKTKSIKS